MGRKPLPPPPPEDDPPDAEWFSPKTEADAPRLPETGTAREPVTAPHPIAGDVAAAFENGRRQGYADGFPAGQEDAMNALREVWAEHFGNDPVIRHTIKRIREKLSPV